MRFAHAEVLWVLLALPLLALLLAHRARRGERELARALGPRMAARLTSGRAPGRRTLRAALWLLALALLVLAAARPQRGMQYVTAHRMGGDVIVALDVSASMLAEDLKPNRLQRARHEIAGLLDRLEGDRIGLVAFAGAAFVQCPLTLDYAAARMFLDYMGPDLIPEPGTDLGQALRVATGAFDPESEGYRALVLITDGEDHGGDVDGATAEARRAGVRVYAVGIGNAQGEPIPERDEAGRVTGFKQDREGRVVMSRLEEETLRRISSETDGVYVRAGSTLGLERIIGAINEMEKRELAGGVRVLYEERYRYFVWPAVALLLFESWMPQGRLRRRGASRSAARGSSGTAGPNGAADRIPSPRANRKAKAALPLGLLLGALLSAGALLPGGACGAQAGPQPGPRTVPAAPDARPPAAGGAAEALPEAPPGELPPDWSRRLTENEVFREQHPGDPRPLYNLGNLYHIKGDFPQAEEFLRAAAPGWDGQEAAHAHYNLGNTLYRAGRLEEAREAYLEALRRDPDDADAKYNLELTQRMIDAVAQQQQQQQQQQDQQGRENPQDSQDQQGQQNQQDREDQRDQQSQDQQDQQSQGDQQSQQDPQERQDQQDQQDRQDQQDQRNQQDQRSGQDAQSSRSGEEREAPQTLDEMQLQQVLRGLEGEERELLERRFQARARRLNVEKDW